MANIVGKPTLSIEEILEAPIETLAELFHKYVKEQLVSETPLASLTTREVERIIPKTSYWELLKLDPEFVLHYDVQYWVDHIYDEITTYHM